MKVPNDDPGSTFGGNLQPGSRFFQLGLNPGVKWNPALDPQQKRLDDRSHWSG